MEGDVSEEEEKDEMNKDTIRKHQFDHNRNTAMTNNYPEMFTDDNGRKVNGQLFFAPAEGNRPTNLQEEKDWDLKSWPALLPEGKFGLHQKRKARLTEQQYFYTNVGHTILPFCTFLNIKRGTIDLNFRLDQGWTNGDILIWVCSKKSFLQIGIFFLNS